MFGKFISSSALVFGATLAASPVTANDAAERAILVLDASGSMWGQVEGTPKITIARDVIQGLLDDWNPDVELGVTAYGHREKGNCSDIETLVPVGAVSGDRVMSAIGSLNPKGKTPLTDAVRQAAETLKYTEERATVLLVSDGKETCDADPCAAAAELEANGIDFTVHVVGFDLTEEEKEQLQCVADNTGGKFLSADNAPELHAAMEKTVQLVAEPEPEPEPAGPTGMKLQAILVDGGEPVKARFDIFHAEQDVDGRRKMVKREHSRPNNPAIIELNPGFYFVTASYGNAERSVEIGVEADDLVEQTITVPAGHLRLAASLTEGGEEVRARFDVFHAKQDIDGRRKLVKREHGRSGEPALFRLAEGDYFVTANYGKAERSFDMQVEAGALTDETLVIQAGHLRLDGTFGEGEEVRSRFDVFHAKQDLDGRRKLIGREHSNPGKPALFQLSEGTYWIEANHGDANEAFEIEVAAGELTEKTVAFGDRSGHLRLTAVLAEGGQDVRAHFQILAADKAVQGDLKAIKNMSSSPGKPSLTQLPEGDYVVVARYGEAEVSEDIQVGAGELHDENIVLNVGHLNLDAALTEGGEPIGVTFQVLKEDSLGELQMVKGLRGKADNPTGFALAAGDYVVKAKYGDAEATQMVNVTAGEFTNDTVVMDAGFLEVWGTRTEGGESMHAKITVYEADPGPDGKPIHVTGAYSKDYKNAQFSLAAGRYHVHAKDGNGGETSIEAEVKAGERTETEIVVPQVD